ncbi:MAG: AAA family ATPase [Candidatus Binatia bacterium]
MEGQMVNGARSGAATAKEHVSAASPQRGVDWAARVRSEVQQAVVGQDVVIERALVALLADGHVLIEGMPGLAKTLLVKSLATALGLEFERVQFTPDLLPADVVGTMVFQPQHGEFTTHRGPIFANLVLADEINRAPAKVQSALLEAMQERQVTIGGTSHPLPRPFLVMATQNPVEQEGTYPLPEAQTDRFLFKLIVDYPAEHEEHGMLRRWGEVTHKPVVRSISSAAELLALRAGVDAVYASDDVQRYIVALVRNTRELAQGRGPAMNGGAVPLAFGASPRATLALLQSSRALAFVRGQDFVTPALVQETFCDAVRHRIGLTYEAEAEQITSDAVLKRVLKTTPIPARA